MFHYTETTKPSHPDPKNLQEFKALHSARNREEELKMEKRQICHEMQVGMEQVEDGGRCTLPETNSKFAPENRPGPKRKLVF